MQPWKVLFISFLVTLTGPIRANDFIWIEGEAPSQTNVGQHPWYYGEINKTELSSDDFLAHFGDQPGTTSYTFRAPAAGNYQFWVRANPLGNGLSFRLNEAEETPIDMNREQTGNLNIAPDNKPDLRFIAWANAGPVTLKEGENTITFTFKARSGDHLHGSLDCFLFTREPFTPMGKAKPDQIAEKLAALAHENEGWTLWNPPADDYRESPIDLRFLNEPVAGAQGHVRVENGRFLLGNGQPVRFWAVNGPPEGLTEDDLRRAARELAKRGVNLVRIHGSVFERETGEFKTKSISEIHAIVAAMKAEGIYTHLSIYFPLWLTPKPGLSFLEGYDGQQHPFAALMFNPEFQKVYQGWWKTLLETKPAHGGPTLRDDPAVFGVEIQNEDSYFFWTFSDDRIPEPQRRILQKQFGDWVHKKYGDFEQAYAAWNGMKLAEDAPEAGRMAFRPLYQLFTDRTPRDQDTVRFLLESQRGFYADQVKFLRDLGFKGLITASNWTTANNEILGPLEKYSYTPGDFIDRHGYWGGLHQGEHSAWSIRDGHTFTHRSALRFDPPEPGKPREVSHPAFDPKYNGLPSMISETTFNRPNRYRVEAPAFYAVYGALQGSDAIVHFAHDGARWAVKPRFFMQPWTLMSPTQMGQFPATALIYRQGLLQEGDLIAEVYLNLEDLLALQGTPLVQSANLDELRKADATTDADSASPTKKIDPMVHLIGRTAVTIGAEPAQTKIQPLDKFLDPAAQLVTASTGEIQLDYGKGLLCLTAPKAQGAVGNLAAAGPIELPALTINSELDLASVLLVPLDGQPIASSRRLLLQVMTEEKPTGFRAEPEREGVLRIVNIGTDPWLIRSPSGTITLKRADAGKLQITPLNFNGYPGAEPVPGPTLQLRPDTAYYLIEAR
ncbi:MAG: hypothetical protein OHK005_15950 [Candidatus Methylacidiphilales bacterium]